MAEQAAEALSAGRARLQRAAMPAAILAGVRPTGGNYPVATLAITGDGAGDQTVDSPVVKNPRWLGANPVRSLIQPRQLGDGEFALAAISETRGRASQMDVVG
jgi:hypothetical protein